MEYLIQSTLCLTALTLCYWLAVKNLKFHSLNRWLLGIIFVLTFVLPQLKYDVPFNPFQYAPQIEENELKLSTEGEVNFSTTEEVSNLVNSDFKEANENLAVHNSQSVFLNIDWWSMVFLIYLTGMAFFILKFGIQSISLLRFFSRTKKSNDNGSLYISPDEISPFSFFNKIVVPSSILNNPELMVILSHEKIHQQSGHTFDVFMSEFVKIIHWFNPLAWIYNKMVRENLEYLADEKTILAGVNKQKYQTCLVNNTFQVQPLSLVNSFANSLIKKRLVMMNTKKNRAISLVIYGLFLIPLFLLTSFFNINSIQETGKELVEQSFNDIEEHHHFVIGPKATIVDLTQLKVDMAEMLGVKLVFDELRFNYQDKIHKLHLSVSHLKGYVSLEAPLNNDKTHILPIYLNYSPDFHGTRRLNKNAVSYILEQQKKENTALHLYGIDRAEFDSLDIKEKNPIGASYFLNGQKVKNPLNTFPIDPKNIKSIKETRSDIWGNEILEISIETIPETKRSLPLYNYPNEWKGTIGSSTMDVVNEQNISILKKGLKNAPFEPKFYIDGLKTTSEILNEYVRFTDLVLKHHYLKPKGQYHNVTEITEVWISSKE